MFVSILCSFFHIHANLGGASVRVIFWVFYVMCKYLCGFECAFFLIYKHNSSVWGFMGLIECSNNSCLCKHLEKLFFSPIHGLFFHSFSPVMVSAVCSQQRFKCHTFCLSSLSQTFVCVVQSSLIILSARPVWSPIPHLSHSPFIPLLTSLLPHLAWFLFAYFLSWSL